MFFKKWRSMIIGGLFLSALVLGIIPVESMPALFAGLSETIFHKVSYAFIFVGVSLYFTTYILIWVYLSKEALKLTFVRNGLAFLVRKVHLRKFYPIKKYWRFVLRVRDGYIPKILQGSIFIGLVIAAFVPGLLKFGTIWCSIFRSRKGTAVLLITAWLRVGFLTYATEGVFHFLEKLF